MRMLIPLAVLLLVAGVATAGAATESRTLIEVLTFSDPAAPKTVEVDNIFGSITVSTHAGAEVRLKARETFSGSTQQDLEEARREVQLLLSERSNVVSIVVDGPFRCRDGGIHWTERDYEVSYDFELAVPGTTDLVLKTVNDGEITVRGVAGQFDVRNVNGGIEMVDVAGGGAVTTVNGGIDLSLSSNPQAEWSLKTINGNLHATFQPGLSGDLRFTTFNGEIYSDFEVEPRTLPRAEPERRDGHFVYKRDRSFGVRVGGGGPELAFDTLNGNIYIHETGR